MAITLESSIRMTDRLSAPVRTMADTVLGLIDTMQAANNTGIDPGDLDTFRNKIYGAQEQIQRLKDDMIGAKNPIIQNTLGQEKWNTSINKGKSAMEGLVNKIKAGIGFYAMVQGAKNIMGLSDETAQVDAKLNFMVDNEQQKENLKTAIYNAAQSARVPMMDFANDVAKLGMLVGDKFSSNREIIDFNTAVAKSFKLTGASASEVAGAMTQLNQAMASGALQGDEFRSVRENAPMIAQAIAKYMKVSQGELKKLASDGKITADIVKNAVLASAQDINNKFASIPQTWKDVWTLATNTIQQRLNGLLKYINKLANSERVQGFVNGMVNAFTILGNVAGSVFSGLAKMASIIYDNWGYIEPIIYGVAGAVMYYGTVQMLSALKSAGALVIKNVALLATIASDYRAIASTEGLAAAQGTLNAAIAACPLSWMAIAIVAIIGVVVAATLAIVKWATKTQTWTEVIVGSLYVLGGVFYNVMLSIGDIVATSLAGVYNGFATTANFIGNVMRDPASAFINFVKDMAIRSLNILQGFAGAVDKIIGSNFASTVENWKGNVNKAYGTLSNKFGNGKYKTIIEQKTSKDFFNVKRLKYGEMYNKGKGVGKAWGDKLSGLGKEKNKNPFDLGGEKNPLLSDMAKDNKKVKDNTDKMAKGLEDTEEDLKYLRELAEQEHINQFTTAEVKVEMNNDNHIQNGADLDEIIRELTQKVENALSKSANGVYQ